MRYQAWLHTAPEPEDDEKPRTRIDEMRWYHKSIAKDDPDYQPPLPPLETGKYLIDAMFQVGPAVPSGMGSAVVPFSEITNWSKETGRDYQPWQLECIHRLARDYVNTLAGAQKRDFPRPWHPDPNWVQLPPDPRLKKRKARR